MNVEQALDKLPIWDKKIAEWMSPAEPAFKLFLILSAIACIWAAWKLKPQYQALFLAYLISP